MSSHRIFLSHLVLLIWRVNYEIARGATLTVDEVKLAAEEGKAMELLCGRFPERNNRYDLEMLTADDRACLNSYFSTYVASTDDYWPIEGNGLCFYIAWTGEMIAQEHWGSFTGEEGLP